MDKLHLNKIGDVQLRLDSLIRQGQRRRPSPSPKNSARTRKKSAIFHEKEEKSRSDEELERELLEAVQSHLKNKPEIKKPTAKTDNKLPSDISRYVGQGAIPKRLGQPDQHDPTKKKSNPKRKKDKGPGNSVALPEQENPSQSKFNLFFEQPNNHSSAAENSNGFRRGQNDLEEKRRKNKNVTRLRISNPHEPFLYIVPKNPSPFFSLPPGNYFITVDGAGLRPVKAIISHPEASVKEPDDATEKCDEDFPGRKSESLPAFNAELNDLGLSQSQNLIENNIHCNGSTEADYNENQNADEGKGATTFISKFEEIEKALLLGDFDRIGIPIEVLKSFLSTKIDALRVAVENLNILQNAEKIDPDLFTKNAVYNKQFGVQRGCDSKKAEVIQDQLFTLSILFPNSDQQNLRREVEECRGAEEAFLKLIKDKLRGADGNAGIDAGFKLLQSNFPNYPLEILYYQWLESMGSEEKLQKFIEEEKKVVEIQQVILAELPEISIIEAKKKAENFLNDESALDRFLSERRLLKTIDEQFAKMTAALPDKDTGELLTKCQELEGNETLVNEYILEVQSEMRKEAHYLNMQSVLPDAEPDFLKQKIEELKGNDNAVNDLTMSLLETNDYPKLVMDNEQQKLWQTYVTNFNVKDFLLEIDGKDLDFKDDDEDLVLSFFRTRYPTESFDLDVEIDDLLADIDDSDMLRVCEGLDLDIEYVELQYSGFKNSKFTKAFLQKVVYIDRRAEIRKYLEASRERKQTEEFLARQQNAFLQCPLCYEDEVVESDAATCSDGHIFCKNCIRRYITIRASDGVYTFQCVSEKCIGFFTTEVLSEILPKSLFDKISFKVGAEEISKANVEGLEFCTSCDYAYIPLPEEKVFFCQNPDCLKETCRLCKEDNHVPLRCEEVERSKDLEARKKIEEAMSLKLIRLCPNCGKKFIKQDGCNKMTCVCGTFMCYICGQTIRDYSHFNSNGGICPLYSNNETLHHRDVLNAGIAARNEILQEDPNIRIFNDPTKEG